VNPITLALFTFLLNAAWKIALVYVAALLLARLIRPLGPAAEHRLWVGALFLEVLLPAMHLPLDTLWARLAAMLFPHAETHGEVHILIGPGSGISDSLHAPAPLVQAAILVYCGIALFFTTRLLWGLCKTHQLTRSAETVSLPAETTRIWINICKALQTPVGKPHIALSQQIRTPITIGVRRQWLLLPQQFLAHGDEAEIEAAFAHECAHMRRHDFAKNLIYSILALPIAFHPLVWRTLAAIAESRELICDDLAATVKGRNRYARSLVRLAEWLAIQPALPESHPLHAIGVFDANIFERRIMQLTHPPVRLRGVRRFAALAICALAATTVCASALAWHVNFNPGMAAGPGMMADAPKLIHVKSDVMQGNLIHQVRPVYPPDAKTARIEGTVVLQATIGKDGAIDHLVVKEGPKELQHSAMDAVKQWRYKPYLLNGDPVEVETTINVTYSLAR